MSITDTDIIPADAPMPVRARKSSAPATAASPMASAQEFKLHVFVGTDTPTTLVFPSKESREKACMSLSQRANRMATTLTSGGKSYTFIYVTHFICEE